MLAMSPIHQGRFSERPPFPNSRRLTALLPLVVLSLAHSRAYSSAGTESAAFLDIPVGAGPASLGGAYTALALDAYSAIWNPAGLGFLMDTQLAGQHLSYLESLHYEQFSLGFPINRDQASPAGGQAVGFAVQYLGSGDFTGRDGSGAQTGDYSSHYGAYSLAYGQALNSKLSLGLTAKVIEAKLGDVSARAYAVDMGTILKINEKLTLAAALAQVGSKMTFLQEGENLPMQARVALAFTPSWHWKMSVEEVYRPKSQQASSRIGLEWKPLEMVAIRAGYKGDATTDLGGMSGFTAGIGLEFWSQEFAYAWVPYGDLGSTQYFSLLLRFGPKHPSRNLIHYHVLRSTDPRRVYAAASRPDSDPDSDPDYKELVTLLELGKSTQVTARPGEKQP